MGHNSRKTNFACSCIMRTFSYRRIIQVLSKYRSCKYLKQLNMCMTFGEPIWWWFFNSTLIFFNSIIWIYHKFLCCFPLIDTWSVSSFRLEYKWNFCEHLCISLWMYFLLGEYLKVELLYHKGICLVLQEIKKWL